MGVRMVFTVTWHDGIFQNQQEIDSYTYVDSNGKTQLIQPNAKPGRYPF